MICSLINIYWLYTRDIEKAELNICLEYSTHGVSKNETSINVIRENRKQESILRRSKALTKGEYSRKSFDHLFQSRYKKNCLVMINQI